MNRGKDSVYQGFLFLLDNCNSSKKSVFQKFGVIVERLGTCISAVLVLIGQ